MFSWPAPLDDFTLRKIALTLSALGGVAGAIGTFAVIRGRSLQGDAISHAALPGIALAFILGGRDPLILILGAVVTGWLAMSWVNWVTTRTRIPFDAALAGSLACFFGLGILLMSYLGKLVGRQPKNFLERWLAPHAEAASRHGMEKYLFGQAAFIRSDDLYMILGLGGGALLLVLIFWKEFKLLSFDRDFASSLGYPVQLLDILLTTIIVVAVVIGLQAVGVVLMSALLVAPAVAARQWSNRLSVMILLASLIGVLSGLLGAVLSHEFSREGRAIPTGPAVVITASVLVLVSLIFAPRSRSQ